MNKKNFYNKNILVALTSTLLFSLTTLAQSTANLRIGDIIFHKSKSQQSAALNEATGSPWTHVGILVQDKNKKGWYVAEAIGPVVTTPLKNFIARGRNSEYRIYRFKNFDPNLQAEALYKAIQRQNKPYDIYFEFSDERTYCSELVYKAFKEVTGQEVGRVQKMKEMKLTGPYVKALIKKRLTDTGRELNPEEPIITPIGQMREPQLTFIQGTPLK